MAARRITLSAVLICLIALGACGTGAEIEVPNTSDLWGNYVYESLVYMNSLSSFLPFNGYWEFYALSEDALVVSDVSGIRWNIPVEYKRVEISVKEFKNYFVGDFQVPDISKYKKRYQYMLKEPTPAEQGFCLFLMDREIWFARMNNRMMWSIFKIARWEGDIPGTDVSVRIESGNYSVPGLVFNSSAAITPQDVTGIIHYLPVDRRDNNGKIEPFSVYAGNDQLFGHYNIYDAETMEALDFIRPSGLAPQTYILTSAEVGRDYIVELESGVWTPEGDLDGIRIFFGVNVTE